MAEQWKRAPREWVEADTVRRHRWRAVLLQRQFADLGVQCFDINCGDRRLCLGCIAENARRPLQGAGLATA